MDSQLKLVTLIPNNLTIVVPISGSPDRKDIGF